jgi:1-acyl-sn-glycerol-3-phosphate acyltransferase
MQPEPDLDRQPPPTAGFRHHLAGLVLRIGGWTVEGDPPRLPRFVVVAAPHTSWWDGFWMIAFAWWWGIRLRWLVKSSAASGPLGRWLRRIGAVPVDRSTPQGLVDALATEIRASDGLILSISPEGTRARRTYWKSGFYRIAEQAGVPICLSYLDYGRRKGGFGLVFVPSGDVRADMDRVRAFYADTRARYADKFTPPRLPEEDELETPAQAVAALSRETPSIGAGVE